MGLQAMLDATRELPQHVLEALDATRSVELPPGPVENVLVVGMGGSSIGGALAARLLEGAAEVPIHVLRGPDPPGFVGQDTLVLATSYSGNTQETLDAVRSSLQRGARLAAITTGGELGPLADGADGARVEVPSGYQPRAAIGWLLTANYTLLARALDVGDPAALARAAKRVEADVDVLAEQGAKPDALAGALGAGPVGVVGHDVLGVLARRWAGEFAENGKRLAFHAELPEMAHNQIVGWAGDPGGATLVLVRRQAEEEQPLERVRLDHLAERADAAGALVRQARLGETGVAGMLRGILFGDLVSLHLARREDTDPEPVDVIAKLKSKLSDAT